MVNSRVDSLTYSYVFDLCVKCIVKFKIIAIAAIPAYSTYLLHNFSDTPLGQSSLGWKLRRE